MNALDNKEDCFDSLPDEIVLIIFNKLRNAKSLLQCSSVNKRFSSLVHKADTLFLSIPRRRKPNTKPSRHSNLFELLVSNCVAKPLHFFRGMVGMRNSRRVDSYYSPNEVLRQFDGIKSVHIEMPRNGSDILGVEGNHSLLKWRAEFGSELKSCVVLGATSFERNHNRLVSKDKLFCNEQEQNGDQHVLTREELKLRVAWTISCLIAASARHGMLMQVLSQNPSLENVVVSDVSKRGKIVLNKHQVFEMRNSARTTLNRPESSLERIPLPDLCIKLWYMPVLELPVTGHVMKGATLLVIRPVNGNNAKGKEVGDLLDFDGEVDEMKAFNEAVPKIMKAKKKCDMTISSF